MFCTNCGNRIDENMKFCTTCGAPVEADTAQKHADPSHDVRLEALPQTQKKHVSKGVVVAIVALFVCVIIGGGILTCWYGLPELLTRTSTPEGSPEQVEPVQDNQPSSVQEEQVSRIPVRESVDAYSWDELSQISSMLSEATSNSEAISIACTYNLCEPSGELANMPPKTIRLSNGTELHARIVGFNHDQREDGGTAGITFLFDEAVALQSWSQSGFNDGGWQASSVRSWLSMTFYDSLPTELKQAIKTVEKLTNNTGGVDSGVLSPDVVNATSDKLWLPSYAELAGTGENSIHWPISQYGTQFVWCDDIVAVEGNQYALFSEVDINSHTSNDTLVRTYEGTVREWWLRTPNPHISNDSLLVDVNGCLDNDAGPIEVQGVVPGFCV